MKRNDWKIILSALIFTYLFYEQSPGANFLIFGIASSIMLLIGHIDKLKNPSVLASLAGTLLSSFFIFLYGTSLPLISFLISISLLAAFVFEPNSSLIIAALNGISSVLLSVPHAISKLIKKRKESSTSKNKFTKVLLLFIPLFITLIFFFLYRAANPNFLEFTKELNFDWISLPLLRFLIFAFILMYGLFSQLVLERLAKKDLTCTDEIYTKDQEQHEQAWIGKKLSIEYELFIGASLLIMLNILLAIVNGIDLVKLWPNRVLPENLESFSAYLHNGVQMLILSIIFAIAIILFFFRGYFNYLKDARWLKILGYIWVAQNIVLLASTVIRNNMYVEAYGLSHKRIGVFIYLLLAVIGLIITIYKLAKKKNSWFLFRKNAWAFYIVLLICTPVAWDRMITKHNIELAEEKNRAVDLQYLNSLSYANLDQLLPYLSTEIEVLYYYNSYSNQDLNDLNNKLVSFLQEYENSSWQATCKRKNEIYTAIIAHNKAQLISSFSFHEYEGNLENLNAINNVRAITIDSYEPNKLLNDLQYFEQLEVLNLSYSSLSKLDQLPVLDKVRLLNLSACPIEDYSYLSKVKNIEKINLSNLPISKVNNFPQLESVVEIDISNNSFYDMSFLSKVPNIKNLLAYNVPDFQHIKDFPAYPYLERANFSNCKLMSTEDNFLVLLSKSHLIQELDLSSNSFNKFSYLLNEKSEALFPNIKYLDLNYNYFTDINGIESMSQLESLNMIKNDVKHFEKLAQLTKLKHLDLSENPNVKNQVLPKMAQLEELELRLCNIVELSFLLENLQIKELDLSNNLIEKLDTIKDLKQLVYLDLSYNNIKEIAALKDLENIETLYLLGNNITNFSALYELKNLKTLYLDSYDDATKKLLSEKLIGTKIIYPDTSSLNEIDYRGDFKSDYNENY